jgi:hypothetical protein
MACVNSSSVPAITVGFLESTLILNLILNTIFNSLQINFHVPYISSVHPNISLLSMP